MRSSVLYLTSSSQVWTSVTTEDVRDVQLEPDGSVGPIRR